MHFISHFNINLILIFFLECNNIIESSEINYVDKVNNWLNNDEMAQLHCTKDNIMNTATECVPVLTSIVSNDLLENNIISATSGNNFILLI